MDSRQDNPQQDTEVAGEVMESLGEPKDVVNEVEDIVGTGQNESNDPLFVQKRLKQQKRSHDREVRELNARIDALQNSQNPQSSPPSIRPALR